MNTIQKLSLGIAQAIADQVAHANDAADAGVTILVAPRGADSDLFYHVTSIRNRALESTTLLCSATSLARLDAHVAGFIANLAATGEESPGLTDQEIQWARSHDWYGHHIRIGDNRNVLTVISSFGDGRQVPRQFTEMKALRDWAGY